MISAHVLCIELPCTALALETDRLWVYIGTKLANVRVDEEVVYLLHHVGQPTRGLA
jgi:uncharacterized SAM-dependent methyltransferase